MSDQAHHPLDEVRIAAYLRGDLSVEATAEVEALMDREPKWLSVLAALAADLGEPTEESMTGEGASIRGLKRAAAIRLHPGQQVGRFVVDRAMGRGGMGVVYAAHDPTLGRDVALKLLHATDDEEQARLAGEARTLAQINHPHVITIHDVSLWRSRLFIAMELIDGETLLQWRMRSAPSWQEVLNVYVDAARGLGAAHQAGVVHRDVKPTNLMITRSGRVVVVDFGLALDMSFEVTLRRSEMKNVGTPAYMSPEHRAGDGCTPQSDQFALAVALYEALYGVLPVEAAGSSRRAPFAALRGVPKRVRAAVQRALSKRPSDRYPSMEAFVEVLHRSSRTRIWPLPAATMVVVVAGAAMLPRPSVDGVVCSGGNDSIEQTWSSARRAAVSEAIRPLPGDTSGHVADTVFADLDAYGTAWRSTYQTACRTARDDRRLGARMSCLERRRRALDGLLEVLEDANDEVQLHVVQAVAGLEDIESCLLETFDDRVPRSEDADAIRDLLALANTMQQSNQLKPAQAYAREALRMAVAMSSAYLEADARVLLGWIQHDEGDFAEAEEQLRLGMAAGTVGHNDEAVSTALHRLAWVVGYKLGRHAEGRKLCDQGQAWSARLGGREQDDISRAISRGWIAHELGELDDAQKHFERARTIATASSKPDAGIDVAFALNGLGSVHMSAGDLDAAQAVFETAAAELSVLFGREHPKVGQVLNNRAGLLRSMGRPEDALDLFERVREIFVEAHGTAHPLVGQVAINMTVVLNELGRHEEALRTSTEALEILTSALGEQHMFVATALVVRADTLSRLERYDEGLGEFHRVLTMQTELLGSEHPSLGVTLGNLSMVYEQLGQYDEALKHQVRAIDLLVTNYGDSHELVAAARMNHGYLAKQLGALDEALALYEAAVEHGAAYTIPLALLGFSETLIELDRPADAIAPLQRARALLVDAPETFGSRGEAALLLAKALWGVGNRTEAKKAAAQAADAARADGDEAMQKTIAAWRATH